MQRYRIRRGGLQRLALGIVRLRFDSCSALVRVFFEPESKPSRRTPEGVSKECRSRLEEHSKNTRRNIFKIQCFLLTFNLKRSVKTEENNIKYASLSCFFLYPFQWCRSANTRLPKMHFFMSGAGREIPFCFLT